MAQTRLALALSVFCCRPLVSGRACDQRSRVAREFLGDAVFEHYLHNARHELEALDRVVTDWELERGFERL